MRLFSPDDEGVHDGEHFGVGAQLYALVLVVIAHEYDRHEDVVGGGVGCGECHAVAAAVGVADALGALEADVTEVLEVLGYGLLKLREALAVIVRRVFDLHRKIVGVDDRDVRVAGVGNEILGHDRERVLIRVVHDGNGYFLCVLVAA